ncbi:hypothetical protein VTK73DRAFT_5390 [Phialemonium thermophilum]|uniref:GPI mannosyltransferase 2 n=1 Tax=Phialemonium thermophilum TaxID=223376 RepID=A0ABR3XX49_9PEZI
MHVPYSAALQQPLLGLSLIFFTWKAILFSVAFASSFGVAYDTSGSLALTEDGAIDFGSLQLPTLIARLTSWDAIYFTKIARCGYVFEQEWAFGSGLPIAAASVVKALSALGVRHGPYLYSLAAILVATVSHWLSVLVLYRLARIFSGEGAIPLIAAGLHIFSPAGLFLSAPYAESTFALLSFLGYLLLAESFQHAWRPALRDGLVLSAGLVFGLSTFFRSNGILNGIPFAWLFLRDVISSPQQPIVRLRRLTVLGIGGGCVAAGSLVPQFVAYHHYCHPVEGTALRPWCGGYLPSIYGFVQRHYWNVGFLRYWTLSNAPLFALASPMLYVLIKSGAEQINSSVVGRTDGKLSSGASALLQSAAAAQILLALLALATYHVQIITRVSSGYPLWYVWLAHRLADREKNDGARVTVAFMVMYASIQGALYTSFLPPA